LAWQERVQIDVATLVAITGAPLEIVESPRFIGVLNSLFAIGQTHPRAQVGPSGCKLYRRKTRTTIIEEGNRIQKANLAKFAQVPSVSLSIDAGTIHGRHFLDIMLLAPYTELTPFLYNAFEAESLTVNDYGRFVLGTIRDLHTAKIQVGSIVGDNLPTQVTALAHWSPRSSLRAADEPFLHGIHYSPCMCHFMQLIVGDFLKSRYGARLEAILQQMIKVSNYAEVRHVLKSRCPQSVKTRWLSRFDAIKWLLSRQERLTRLSRDGSVKKRQKKIQTWMTSENFGQLEVFHQLLYPFNQATKFFEQDMVTLCHVYPALRDVKNHLRQLLDHYRDSDAEIAESCQFLLDAVHFRRRKLLDRDLMKAAFWLTSFGCRCLNDGEIVLAAPYRVVLEYELPHAVAPRGSLDFSIPSGSSQEHEEDDNDELDCEFEGDGEIDEDTEDVPRLDPSEGTGVIAFLCVHLRHAVLTGSDRQDEDKEAHISDRVDQLLQFFFCNVESQRRCKNATPDVNRQVELWNRLSVDDPDPVAREIIAKIIAVITIPASETSCERALSRQKRIMGHSRVKSNPDLLLARFVFDSKDF
jgi:hypothetical protein